MRHLLNTADLSREEALTILDTAEAMAETQERQMKKLPTLRGKTVVNLFFEDSTRTRISFETAAKRLSADVINFSAKGSSVSKGESLKDTAQTLDAMGIDGVVVRHSASGAPHRLANTDWIDVPIINAGDGAHQHPTQALLDAFTLRRHLGGDGSPADNGTDLAGRHVAIVGDILHSRVVRSNVDLLNTLGARVTVVGPSTLIPVGAEAWKADISYDFDAVIDEGPDAVMMLRVQHERMGAGGFFPSPQEYVRNYGLDKARLNRLPDHAMVMHPGPMNRGLEISADAADSPRALVLQQVANGVFVRMAVLYLLLASQEGSAS
ncbi:MAG TPA: aspartate carbamoyltransferase catalytic subunit [Actinomycetales bacterium]|nr:aspartate carbamoyltransferase catalytic subunit [Actinomycetales bacterium]